MGIKVRVKGADDNFQAVGYFDHQRRYVGDVFEVPEDKQVGSWMEPLDSSAEIREAEEEAQAKSAERRSMRGRVKL